MQIVSALMPPPALKVAAGLPVLAVSISQFGALMLVPLLARRPGEALFDRRRMHTRVRFAAR